MTSGVALKGGYAGRGTPDPNARDIQNYATVLSGDPKGNDLAYEQVIATESKSHPTWMDNSHIVVQAEDVDSTGVLDGIVVTHAHSNADLSGGLVISRGSPAILRCTFVENIVYDGKSGAGISMYDQAHPILTSCVVRFNTAWEGTGGGLYVHDSHLTLVACTLSYNQASQGGALCKRRDEPLNLDGCAFVANQARFGGAVYIGMGTPGLDLIRDNVYIDGCLFAGNVASVWTGAIYGEGSILFITNCVLTQNRTHYGGAISFWGNTQIANSVIWNNYSQQSPDLRMGAAKYCCIEVSAGYRDMGGNIGADPCFVDPGYWNDMNTPEDCNDDVFIPGDYHLKSQAGHWDALNSIWLPDDTTSPCIDAANPDDPVGHEPFPNGGRPNMGAYGGTIEASKSYFGELPCQTVIAGDINGDCKVDNIDLAILTSHWLEPLQPLSNQPPRVYVTSPWDGWKMSTNINWIPLAAYAWDNDGTVVKVEFFINGKAFAEDYDGSDGWRVDESFSMLGTYTITAIATDDAGATTLSDPVMCEVIDW